MDFKIYSKSSKTLPKAFSSPYGMVLVQLRKKISCFVDYPLPFTLSIILKILLSLSLQIPKHSLTINITNSIRIIVISCRVYYCPHTKKRKKYLQAFPLAMY